MSALASCGQIAINPIIMTDSLKKIGSLESAENIVGKDDNSSFMNFQEFKKIIEYLNWTQAQTAAFLHCDERNIRRYCSGKSPIPKLTAVLMRAVVQHPQLVRWLSEEWLTKPL